MKACNNTLSDLYIDEEPLWRTYTFHDLGLLLAAVFGFIALTIGLTLVFLHATHYLKPWEQRHIIRILLLIPIYSTVSFLSYLFYRHAVYFDVLEGCYEAFAISSFFTLLCHYVAPNLHDQKEYFRGLKPKNWFWGVFGLQKITGGENKGPFRKPRSGLTWFNVVWIGVFQYCFIRVFFTIVAVLTEYFDVYCEDSLSPIYAHVWVECFEAVSVTVAMFCLVQFYIQLKDDLAEHRPFLKVLCIKLVIFFSFWQTIVISFLSSERGPLQPTKTLSYPDISVGIPSVLLCIEMSIFAVMHIFAFPWKIYSLRHGAGTSTERQAGGADLRYKGGPLGLYAIVETFNPWDIMKMTARGFRWLFVGVRHRHHDVSYQRTKTSGEGMGWDGHESHDGAAPATELESRGRSGTVGTVGTLDDDHAGLLSNQRIPSRSPYRPATQNDASRPYPMPGIGMSEASFEQDTGYHPGFHPSDSAGQQQGWDVFGGAAGPPPRDNDVESVRPPPSYRTDDPGRAF